MYESVEGSHIIVTGAAGGIGAGILKGLVKRGAHVAAIYNSTKPADDIVGIAKWYQCDLTNKSGVLSCFDAIVGELGGLDALINVAGLWQSGPAEDADDEQIDHIFAANVKSAIFTNQAAYRYMKESGGRIVNFGSLEAMEGNARSPIYSTVKGALHSWTRSAARSWGKYGITVNAIAPLMHTPLVQSIRDSLSKEDLAKWNNHLVGRFAIGDGLGNAELDCTPMVAFLASEGSHFITGQLLSVDGGMRMMGA